MEYRLFNLFWFACKLFFYFSDSKLKRSGPPNRGFPTECVTKINLSRHSFVMGFGIVFIVFGSRESGFFAIFCLEHSFENETFLVMSKILTVSISASKHFFPVSI